MQCTEFFRVNFLSVFVMQRTEKCQMGDVLISLSTCQLFQLTGCTSCPKQLWQYALLSTVHRIIPFFLFQPGCDCCLSFRSANLLLTLTFLSVLDPYRYMRPCLAVASSQSNGRVDGCQLRTVGL